MHVPVRVEGAERGKEVEEQDRRGEDYSMSRRACASGPERGRLHNHHVGMDQEEACRTTTKRKSAYSYRPLS
jgi:hypothetical protein